MRPEERIPDSWDKAIVFVFRLVSYGVFIFVIWLVLDGIAQWGRHQAELEQRLINVEKRLK